MVVDRRSKDLDRCNVLRFPASAIGLSAIWSNSRHLDIHQEFHNEQSLLRDNRVCQSRILVKNVLTYLTYFLAELD